MNKSILFTAKREQNMTVYPPKKTYQKETFILYRHEIINKHATKTQTSNDV